MSSGTGLVSSGITLGAYWGVVLASRPDFIDIWSGVITLGVGAGAASGVDY